MVDDVLAVQKCGVKSQTLNTTINTFIELEKLELSQAKSNTIHIGNNYSNCPDLRVHGMPMNNSKCEKYLGDIIHKSGNNKSNIHQRITKGWGKVNEILALVKEAPFGFRKISAGLLMRQALLINGTLFNSEAWHGFTNTQVAEFSKLDEALIRGLVQCFIIVRIYYKTW